MSRGSGRLQRRIVELLEAAPEYKRTRVQLDEVLVMAEGFDPSNVLRSIKSLQRVGHVIFRDSHRKEAAIVQLPPKTEPVPESKVYELLAEIGGRKV